MFVRVFAAFRVSVTNVCLAILAMAVALITPVGAGVSEAADGGQLVLCSTFSLGNNDAHFGNCTNKVATGGSVKVNFNELLMGGHVTFKWASGKITVANLTVSEGIAACGGMGDDSWVITGPIVKDTTGRVRQPVYISLCNMTASSSWTIFGGNPEF